MSDCGEVSSSQRSYAASIWQPHVGQFGSLAPWLIVCPNCGTGHFGSHACPALRDLSPMGGGPNPWKDKPK